jgi:hypothetical protein
MKKIKTIRTANYIEREFIVGEKCSFSGEIISKIVKCESQVYRGYADNEMLIFELDHIPVFIIYQ